MKTCHGLKACSMHQKVCSVCQCDCPQKMVKTYCVMKECLYVIDQRK